MQGLFGRLVNPGAIIALCLAGVGAITLYWHHGSTNAKHPIRFTPQQVIHQHMGVKEKSYGFTAMFPSVRDRGNGLRFDGAGYHRYVRSGSAWFGSSLMS